MNERATLSVPEVAQILGIGKNKAYELVKSGRFPALRIDKRIVIPKATFERWLNNGIDGYESAVV